MNRASLGTCRITAVPAAAKAAIKYAQAAHADGAPVRRLEPYCVCWWCVLEQVNLCRVQSRLGKGGWKNDWAGRREDQTWNSAGSAVTTFLDQRGLVLAIKCPLT